MTPDLGLELHRLVQFPEEEKASGGNWRREQGGGEFRKHRQQRETEIKLYREGQRVFMYERM